MKMMVQTESQVIEISIAKDFTRFPGPRERWQGKHSGQEFFEEILEPKFLEARIRKQSLLINLDGTEGYSSAFLDGSLGLLARKYGVDETLKIINFITNDEPYLEKEINYYMKQMVK